MNVILTHTIRIVIPSILTAHKSCLCDSFGFIYHMNKSQCFYKQLSIRQTWKT